MLHQTLLLFFANKESPYRFIANNDSGWLYGYDSECARNTHIILLRGWPFGQIVNSTFAGLLHETLFLSTRTKFHVRYAHVIVSTACRDLTITGFWISATHVTSRDSPLAHRRENLIAFGGACDSITRFQFS